MAAEISKPPSTLAPKRLHVPSEQTVWQKYSPHHEFPLSVVGSFCLHALGIGLLLLLVFLAALGLVKNRDPLPMEPIAMGGGGGMPGAGTGTGTSEAPRENVNPDAAAPPENPPPVTPLKDLPRVKVDPIEFPEFKNDPDAMRMIEESNLAAAALAKLGKDARKQLMQGLGTAGQGGTGRDGGKGTGTDKGSGPGVGPGDGKMNARTQRVLRWIMMFDTLNGNDYANQLQALGAILGIPAPENQYTIVRDLKARPATGKIEDLRQIQRIFWVDDVPDSVRALSTALQLPQVPPHIVAFFPERLEAELLKKELAFRGKKEHEIKETRFRVVRKGSSYEAVVVDQR